MGVLNMRYSSALCMLYLTFLASPQGPQAAVSGARYSWGVGVGWKEWAGSFTRWSNKEGEVQGEEGAVPGRIIQ